MIKIVRKILPFGKLPNLSCSRFTTLSNSDKVLVEKNGPVMTIVLNNPKNKNAISRQVADDLSAAINAFEQDDTIKVGVLYGKDTFCSGADLKAIADGNVNRLEDEGDAPLGVSRRELSKPMIAAIAGHAVAGGMELALWCDLRVMEDDAIFGIFCRRWGVPLIDGGTVRLPRLIGMSRAMDLILTGRPVKSQEALDIGLANRVVNKGTALEYAQNLALEIAGFPQECLLADRRNAYEQHELSYAKALKMEFLRSKPIAQYKLMDGIQRFKNKEYKEKEYNLH